MLRNIIIISWLCLHYLQTTAQVVPDADKARQVFEEARALLKKGDYTAAEQAFATFRQMPGLGPRSIQAADKYLADCRFSIRARERPVPFDPVNLGPAVNSDAAEYFPMLTADRRTLIYTRKANNRENFYETVADSTGTWQPAVLLRGHINSDHFNEGAHCISPDGKYLFFTGCNRPDGLGSCDLYVSRREGDEWGEPHNLGAPINTRGWEAQPALSADGRTLYFVSNRPGGQGGYDIWKSELGENGHWNKPANLGPCINTAYDESSPYIHADNRTLYFASDGWPGLGDKDIFVSRLDSLSNWSEPVNLGYPINDHAEQISLTVSMNGRQAFFSSVRADGFGGLDLYTFELPEHAHPKPVAYLKGLVTDGDTRQPLVAQVTITDIRENKALYRELTDYEDGTFLAPLPFGNTYALHVKQPGYLFYSENYTLADTSKVNDAYEISVQLSPIKAGRTEILNNIFFETNRFTLLPESKADLDALTEFLKLNREVGIEIGGHTDHTGTAATNQLLSENRARTVYEHLLKQGIPPKRMSYRGYGQEQPIADNSTEEGRSLNRRTDFRITTVD